MGTFRDKLVAIGACDEAVKWVGERDGATAWRECPRGDWLLWHAARVGCDRRALVRAACDCAETALMYVQEGEGRPARAIAAARAWADAPSEETREAARVAARVAVRYAASLSGYAANCAACAASYAAGAASYAAGAAGYAADAAYDAADAAYDAADAAGDAARAAGYAAWAAGDAADAAGDVARADAHADCADLVRARISWADVAVAARAAARAAAA